MRTRRLIGVVAVLLCGGFATPGGLRLPRDPRNDGDRQDRGHRAQVAILDRWVESGTKPQSVVASHMTGTTVDRTRPLCAYPAVARYVGSGSTDEASNFRCQSP
jgi:hypothetical protein